MTDHQEQPPTAEPEAAQQAAPKEYFTAEDVKKRAIATLGEFSRIANNVSEQQVVQSVDTLWPKPPSPIIFWLWLAGSADIDGASAARSCLASLELVMTVLQSGQPVRGSWQSRVGKLKPPRARNLQSIARSEAREDYTEFYSALFELNLAVLLCTGSAEIEIQADQGAQGGELAVSVEGERIVTVEAYAPRKGALVSFETHVVRPWQELIGHHEEPHDPPREGAFRDISLDPQAVSGALSRVLTDGNFAKQKAKQLGSGDVPTLLAIRAYGLIPGIENLLPWSSPSQLAEEIEAEAWAELPPLCKGLLLCFTGDVIPHAVGPIFFIPAPGRDLDPRIQEYLAAAGVRF